MNFQRNIEALKPRDPELAEVIVNAPQDDSLQTLSARNGMPSLRCRGIMLHSLYDPVKEAKGWVNHHREEIEKDGTIIVFGFGLGYHIIELCHLTNKDIVVFEPSPDILKTAFERVDLTPVISRIRLVTGHMIPDIQKGFIILEHSPSINMNPHYFEKIRVRLRLPRRIKQGLRIMVVSPIYGGSFPVARFCALALRNLGHKVDFIDNSIYKDAFLSINSITSNKGYQNQLGEMFVNFVSETIIARCNEFKPDLILALAQAPLAVNSLKKLKDNGVPTAFWFVEDFRFMEYWKDVAPLCDYFFTIQRGELFERLKEIRVENFSYLPLAASADVHKEVELTEEEIESYGSDVSFVGAGYKNRRRFFEGLIDLDFKIWGNEWDLNAPIGKCIQRSGERMDTEEIVKIFNATKININLHSSTYHNGVNPYGDFVNPRTFEIAACGGFQLIDYRSDLPELFEIDKEIVCFKDIYDLRNKIAYYLHHPDERREIACSGRERVLKGHTYEQRMRQMLDFILGRGYEPPAWKRDTEDVEILKDASCGNLEVTEYFERFADKGEIGLPDIINDIQSGDGNLSRVERIFLLMNALEKDHRKGAK